LAALVVGCLYGGVALTVDFPKAAGDIQSDEATYLLMGYSLAYDGDLQYRAEDLTRAFSEWKNGPNGIFLKRGVDVTGFRPAAKPPFFEVTGWPETRKDRFYYGKSFAYPLFAAPFVRIAGTNGFLILNALLITAAFLAAYTFVAARSSIPVALLLASAFVFASVMPVYFVWTTPELFNFSLAVCAYFLWLYKLVAPPATSRLGERLRAPWTDVVAGATIGLLTFSKVTNVLFILPLVGWLAWRRDWRRALLTGAACVFVAAAFFGMNLAVSGDWNYQGGERVTCSGGKYPFQQPDWDLGVCSGRGRDTSLWEEIFDPQVFWSNLRANVAYFFVGRYGGLVAYSFPAVFALVAFLAARGKRALWQWFVLGGIALSISVFIITLPYTYLGDGGSIGNRYFTGVYGLTIFLLPPIESLVAAVIPWIVGGLFMAKLVLNPFQTSIRPFDPAKSGPLRLLPVELTQVNGLPIMNEIHRVRLWYGNPRTPPQFQIYHLDDNAYLREADGESLSIRGASRAEMLIKADSFVDPDPTTVPLTVRPPRQLEVMVTARADTDVVIEVGSSRVEASLVKGQEWIARLPLPAPFLYNLTQGERRAMPALIWKFAVTTTNGMSPRMVDPASPDDRYLGALIRPNLLR
jgi:hypothetical protein